MRRFLLLFALLVVFLALFLKVALRRQAPAVPADELHLALRGGRDDCLSCHGPGGSRPRGPNHPFGERCWDCHRQAPPSP